jgi:hypothetical protein
MLGFEPAKGAAQAEWELKMLPLEGMNAQVQAAAAAPPPPPPANAGTGENKRPEKRSEAFAGLDAAELSRRAADGLLINGTANNGASSVFAQAQAFGNNRRNGRPVYNGNIGVILGNSVFDARPYSLTGQNTARPDYSRLEGVVSFGGPFKIPKLVKNGPNFAVDYQWVRRRNVTTQSSRVPELAERIGDFSGLRNPVVDPTTGTPFAGNVVPLARISPQSKALLELYPLPNFASPLGYNFQVPLVGNTHQDNLQSRANQRLPKRNQVFGNFALQSTRTDAASIFGFVDNTRTMGINTAVNFLHMFSPRRYAIAGVQFSSLSAQTIPFFSNRQNVSAAAGIIGNNQEPVNWGPPSLQFASGIASLGDAQYSRTKNRTSGVSAETGWSMGSHSFTLGGDYKRQQFNVLGQEDPRGTFAFTGAAAGSDFAGFLLGVPDTSSIAFGNADKYLRATLADAYFVDDWRWRAGFTLNMGLRWEYGSPVRELYGRLVNLDVEGRFASVSPVVGGELVRPDRNNFAPRVGFAWRPKAASSMVIRGGYGIYYDTSVYQWIAMQMAQQSPLSNTLRVENSAANPLTLADGFRGGATATRNTFAIDPAFRLGYSQNWQTSLQSDLPAGLVMIATYAGIKGTRGQQQFLPNTFPAGAANPCAACPAGFTYLVSNGNSSRQAGTLEVRRRLRSGFSAGVTYTYSKSIDNAALGGKNQGGILLAQDWLNLAAERALSNFDQRHLVSFQTQYSTGMGARGGMLMGGWRGAALKQWTVTTSIAAGTGLPLTPIYFASVRGTGVTGTIRPDYTGAPLYEAAPGVFLNRAAYAEPAPGRWGNAGRNSITGPGQFTMNASLARAFRLTDRLSLDFRVDATNVLNHPVYAGYNTTTTSPQFGLASAVNGMRSLGITGRVRF